MARGSIVSAIKKARLSKKRAKTTAQASSGDAPESAVPTGRRSRTSLAAAQAAREPTPPPPPVKYTMIVHCTAVLEGSGTAAPRAPGRPKTTQGLPQYTNTIVPFYSNDDREAFQHIITMQVFRQTGKAPTFEDLNARVAVASTQLKDPFKLEFDHEYDVLLEALGGKAGKAVNVYCDVEVEAPTETSTSIDPDSSSQLVGTTAALGTQPTTPTGTPQLSQSAAERLRRQMAAADGQRYLDACDEALASIHANVPLCEEHRRRRNADVRCYIAFNGVHHPLDHRLAWEWAQAIGKGQAKLDYPPDDILVRSLDRVASARGIHAVRTPNRPERSSPQSAAAPSSQNGVLATTVGADVHRDPTAVTPSPAARTALGALSSNAVAAAPARPSGPRLSVWKFVILLDEGGQDLAARLTRAGVKTMSALAKASERGAFGQLKLTDVEQIEVEEWLEEWRESKFESESCEERASSIRFAVTYAAADGHVVEDDDEQDLFGLSQTPVDVYTLPSLP